MHKLLEEVVSGDLNPQPKLLAGRAAELIEQLASLSQEATPLPDPVQSADCVRATLAIGDVASLLPFLEAEFPVWHAEGGDLLAGRVDAWVVRNGRVLGVLDWKSDAEPTSQARSIYAAQLADYLSMTGAIAGAVVFVTTGEIVWIGDRHALLANLTQ